MAEVEVMVEVVVEEMEVMVEVEVMVNVMEETVLWLHMFVIKARGVTSEGEQPELPWSSELISLCKGILLTHDKCRRPSFMSGFTSFLALQLTLYVFHS